MHLYRTLSPLQKRAMIALAIICSVSYWAEITRVAVPYILPRYEDLNLTEIQRIMNISSLVGIPIGFLAGMIALKINKKYLLMGSIGSIAVFYAVYYFTGLTNGPSWLLWAGDAISGIGTGSALALINSIISEYFPADNHAVLNANFTALMSGGSMVMNLSGGHIAAVNEGASWYNVYLLGIYIVAAIVAFGFLMPRRSNQDASTLDTGLEPVCEEPDTQGGPKFIPLKVFGLIGVGILTSLSLSAYMNNISFFIVTDYKLGSSVQAGIAASLYQFTGLFINITYLFWSKFFKKYIHIIGLGCFTLGNYLIYSMGQNSLTLVYTGVILINMGFCLLNPYYVSRIMFNTPKRWLPMALALSNVGISIGMVLSADVINSVSALFGPDGKFKFLTGTLGGILCMALSFFVYFAWKGPLEKAAGPKFEAAKGPGGGAGG